MTQDEINELIGQTVSGLVSSTKAVIEENKRLGLEVSALKNPKKDEVIQATPEEARILLNRILPPDMQRAEVQSTSSKEVKDLLKKITPWMQ